jgi:hypothetical protein
MATSFARRETALVAITNAMGELGLEEPEFVVNNPDKTTAQFLKIANRVGKQLVGGEYKWQILSRELTITTVVSQANYALPEDFNGFEPDASWNRSTRLPVIGSLSEQEWQMLQARLLAGSTFTMLYRLEDDEIVFYEAPNSVQTIVMPYTSRGWVENVGGDRQDQILADTDIILFDPQLFNAALRKGWYEAKQFNTAKIEKEYKRVEASAKANDSPGRTLSLRKGSGFPFLGPINVPDTNFG